MTGDAEGEEETFQTIFEHGGLTYHVVEMPKGIPLRVARWEVDPFGSGDLGGVVFGFLFVIVLFLLYVPFELLAPARVAVIRYKDRLFSKTDVLYLEQYEPRADTIDREVQLSRLLEEGVFDPEVFAATAPPNVKRVRKAPGAEQGVIVERSDWSLERKGHRFEVVESAMGFPLNFAGAERTGVFARMKWLSYRSAIWVTRPVLPVKVGIVCKQVDKRLWPVVIYKEHRPPRTDILPRRRELLGRIENGEFDHVLPKSDHA